MKKLYLLITLLIFALQHTNAQLTTETFEGSTTDIPTFTNGTKFNLTSNVPNFTFLVYQAAGLGYNSSNRFIQVQDDAGSTGRGQTGTIKAETGVFQINNLWIYLTGDAGQNPGVTSDGAGGSVTFTGKLAGVTKFVVTKTTLGNNIGSSAPNKGFIYVDFVSEGGNDVTNIQIDQLDVTLSNNYDYFAIDNFTFTKIVAPTFTSHPSSKTVCPSGNTSFSITASNATSYQWQVNTGSGFTNISNTTPYSGVTTNTLSITGATSSMNGYQYRCIATGSGSTNSNAATLTVPTAISTSVSAQTNVSAYGLANGSATISASGGTPLYTYSWAPSGGSDATATGLTAGTYVVTITDSTQDGPSHCSTTQQVTITQPPGASVDVSSLSGFSTCSGSASTPKTFSVNAGGLVSNLSLSSPTGYEISSDPGGAGTYTSSLDIVPSSGNISRTIYVRLAANATGTPSGNLTVSSTGITTKTIALTGTVNSAPVITAHPSSIAVCSGSNTTFSVTASNATGYKWQVDQGLGAGFVDVPNGLIYSGATTATLSVTGVTSAFNGYKFQVIVNGGCPPNATSNSATLSINPAPSITTQPSVTPVCIGDNTTISVTASNATGYQWYVDQGTGFNPLSNDALYSGVNTATLIITGVTAALSTYIYRVVASGNCTPAATSNNVALIVNSSPSITAQPSAKTICPGDNTTFNVNASNVTGYQWQVDQGQGAGFVDVPNNAPYSGMTTATLTITGATASLNGYLYRAIASGTCTPVAISNNALLTINPTPIITSDPVSTTVCSGSPATFSVTASNATGYQWQVDNGTGFVNVPNNAPYSGITTTMLTITGAPATFNGYKYRAVTTGSCTPAATSNSATLTVKHISIATSKTDIKCSGDASGTATATPTGGTGSYTYSWSNGGNTATITGLIPGPYTVTITDENSCQSFATVVIGQPSSALTLTKGITTNASCNGGGNGSAQVIASGGTLPYTYSWNTNPVRTTAAVNGLSAGTYTVTVRDDNQCEKTLDFEISEPPALELTQGSITHVSCNGGSNGSATVNVTGGTPNYSYSWNTVPVQTTATATGLIAGTYIVTVMDDNTCTKTLPFTISEPAILDATTSSTDALCNGSATGTATVTPSGGSSTYTYLWSPSGGTANKATGLATGNYSCQITDSNGCNITKTFTIGQPSALVATTSQTNATCSTGGMASVAPSGGAGGYTYLWSPGGATTQTVNNLATGNYSCLITDANGCSISKSFTINTTNTLVATSAQVNVKCNGDNTGSATVTPSGAPGPYTYVWSPSGGNSDTAINLAAGDYSVTITAGNGCSIVKNFTIIEPPAIVITKTSQIDVTCPSGSNGSLAVNVTGGTGAYTYSWAPSGGTGTTATGLTAGTYTLTVTDANQCVKTQNFTITQPNAITASISKTNVSCNGGSNGTATVSVTGGTGSYTYLWSPSGGTAATATGLSAGTYTVTIKDANLCETIATVTIAEPPLLTATIAKTDVLCNQANNGTATVTPSGGAGSYTYSWSPSGGTAATATGLSPNIYSVTVTDANGCSVTESVQITEPSSLSVTDSHTNVSCNGGNNGTASVVATGGTGAYTYSWSPSGGNAATATGLAAGVYTVTVTDENLCSVTNTITITQPDPLNLNATPTAVSCNGGNNGSATVNVTGGTGAYSYSWAPSGGNAATATGLTAGSYTVTVTDANSCTATATVEILQPANPITLNTLAVSGVTVNGASLSGTASSDGINSDKGECLTEVGFVYAQHSNPTTADIKINVTAALGTFTNTLSGLRGNRTYHVRTYAVNSNGVINYGNEVSFTTEKYTLTINASLGHTKVYGTADPVFNYTVLGFANGDTNSIITGLLSRDAGENVGKYNIKLGSISAGADYTIVFTGAEFEIIKANQTITWNQTLEFGCSSSNTVNLTATSDSGLPVSYTIANTALGTISGTTLNITGSGNTTITAVQNGDQNHNPAAAVVKPIEISQSGLVVQQWANVLFFDNKSNNFVAWQWYKNGVAVSGATRQYYSEIQPLNGTYYVIAKDKNGNSIKSCPIEASGTVFTKQIKIYPNPVKPGSEFTLECGFNESQLNGSEVAIYDIAGKIVQTISNVKPINKIIAPSQTALYIVVLKLADGQLKTINLLVK